LYDSFGSDRGAAAERVLVEDDTAESDVNVESKYGI
jgi:hypothetical protein